MERLLLKDRARRMAHGESPDTGSAASGRPDARDKLSTGGPNDDVSAAAAAAAAAIPAAPAASARRRMKTAGKESPVRHPAPKDVKAVRLLLPTEALSLVLVARSLSGGGAPRKALANNTVIAPVTCPTTRAFFVCVRLVARAGVAVSRRSWILSPPRFSNGVELRLRSQSDTKSPLAPVPVVSFSGPFL